jgi:hypothetical protein
MITAFTMVRGAGKLEADRVAFAATVKEMEVKRLLEIKGHLCPEKLSCS